MVKRASLLSLVLLSCSETPRTQVMVFIEADAPVQARADQVLIEVDGRLGSEVGAVTTIEYGDGSDELALRWPLRIAVVPEDNDAARTFRIRASAIEADRDFLTVRAETGFAPERTLGLRLLMDTACADVLCATNETCRQGDCDERIEVGADELFELDDEGNPLMDGGIGDSGGQDAGRVDSGSGDVGPPDSAADSQTLMDSAVDGGPLDSGVDAPVEDDAAQDGGPTFPDPCTASAEIVRGTIVARSGEGVSGTSIEVDPSVSITRTTNERYVFGDLAIMNDGNVFFSASGAPAANFQVGVPITGGVNACINVYVVDENIKVINNGGYWGNPLDWTPHGEPDESSTVLVRGNVTYDGTRTVGGLYIETGANLISSSGVLSVSDFVVSGGGTSAVLAGNLDVRIEGGLDDFRCDSGIALSGPARVGTVVSGSPCRVDLANQRLTVEEMTLNSASLEMTTPTAVLDVRTSISLNDAAGTQSMGQIRLRGSQATLAFESQPLASHQIVLLRDGEQSIAASQVGVIRFAGSGPATITGTMDAARFEADRPVQATARVSAPFAILEPGFSTTTLGFFDFLMCSGTYCAMLD